MSEENAWIRGTGSFNTVRSWNAHCQNLLDRNIEIGEERTYELSSRNLGSNSVESRTHIGTKKLSHDHLSIVHLHETGLVVLIFSRFDKLDTCV